MSDTEEWLLRVLSVAEMKAAGRHLLCGALCILRFEEEIDKRSVATSRGYVQCCSALVAYGAVMSTMLEEQCCRCSCTRFCCAVQQ